MNYSDFKLQANDHQDIYCVCWSIEDESKAKGIVQIAHGMAEHIARYERFAKYLNENGYIVYGNDHRGHGRTAGVLENVGFFAEENGFEKVVQDMALLTDTIKEKHKEIPLCLFGHSMGSALSRAFVIDYSQKLDGLILSGTLGDPGVLRNVGLIIAKLEGKIKGKRAKSPLLDKLTFGSYNGKIKPIRTKFDWLSRDEKEVDKYVNDPYCGEVFSNQFFNDMLGGVPAIFDPNKLLRIAKTLPIFLFAGEMDPVGNYSKGVKETHQLYLNAGIENVKLKLYPDGRHEMINEINKEEVYQDVLSWLEEHLSR